MPLDDLPPPDQSAPDAAAAAPEAAAAPVSPAPGDVPSPFSDVLSGSIPAIIVPPMAAHGKPDPVQEFAASHFGDLLQAGLDYHETKDDAVVFFNPKVLTPAQVDKAEKNGTLGKIAQPATAIAAPAAAPAGPALADAAPAAAPAAPSLASAPAPMPVPAGAPVPPQINNARRQMLAPRQVSPIQPNPVVSQVARRAV